MALVKYNNNSLSAVTSTGLTAGAMTLIKSQTASSSSTIDFVNGTSDVVFDGTYPIYVFKFINIHPGTDASYLTFQADTGTNTSYNQTMTTTYFQAKQKEDDSGSGLEYATGDDQAQATAFQRITGLVGSDNDQCASGEIFIYSPSSSTYVKHFMSKFSFCDRNDRMFNSFAAGYFNTTTALTRLQFKFHQGNIDAGTIKLYGIKDS
tara:strand:- start:27 stop:647 length:621 start_codon:yes stop_codon:yes gene_type:complete